MYNKPSQETVSVCVISYNSEKYIIDTLESIRRQTYSPIELIISDDFSSDNTVDICKRWATENKQHFANVQIIESPQNTGVSANCNRAYNAATGTWVKCIAGDDLLLPDAIETYVKFINDNPACRICYGYPIMFGSKDDLLKQMTECFEREFHKHIRQNLQHQKKEIVKRLFVPGPGLFVQKKLWEDVGGFDEAYPFCEEYPFTLKVLERNNKIWWIGKPTIKYRLTENSLSHNSNQKVSYIHFKDNYAFFRNVRKKLLLRKGHILLAIHLSIKYHIANLEYLKDPKYKKAKLLQLLSPLWYIEKIQYVAKRSKK